MLKEEFTFELQRFSNFSNSNDNFFISGTSGNDSILSGDYVDEGNNNWKYIGDYVTINGGAGDDTIDNEGSNVSINGGAGKDSLHNGASENVTLDGGDGDDAIDNYISNVTINGGKGNDSIDNSSGSSVSISAGDGNDYIYGYHWDNFSVMAGKGNDTIDYNSGFGGVGNVYIYNDGDGNDYITGFGETDTLLIPKGTWSTTTNAKKNSYGYKNVIVTVGKGTITLEGAASLSSINIVSSAKDIHSVNVVNTGDWDETVTTSLITGISYRDLITNNRFNVTIDTGKGDDTVLNSYASGVSINAGDDNDYIDNWGSQVTVNGGAGNDYIYSNGDNYNTLNGGAGNDTIEVGSLSEYSTINGGKGNDIISINSGAENNLIVYNKGDGNDTVYGYGVSDAMSLKGDKITGTSVSGNDLTLNTSSGSIRFVNIKSVVVDGAVYGDTAKNGTKGNDVITNFSSNTTINALGGNDTINNAGEKVLIQASGGDNEINNYGAQSTITLGAGDDSIYNKGSASQIFSGEGNDSINNHGDNVTIDGGAGNDSIDNYGDNVTINGGAGKDSINNHGDNVTIDGGAGNDYIETGVMSEDAKKVSINGGVGDDTIYNDSYDATINSGEGKDSVLNGGDNSTIDTGAGNDKVRNVLVKNVSINTGAGNDAVVNENFNINVTMVGGKGNDTFSVADYSDMMGMVYVYNNGDGNDLIKGLGNSDTILISDAKWTTKKSGKDIIVTVGKGNITLKNAASLSSVNIVSSKKDINPIKIIENEKSKLVLKGTKHHDYIENSGNNVTINSGDGNDYVINKFNTDNVKFDGGDGDDTINNYGGNNATIDGGTGNDYIDNQGNNAIINGGAGNDSISNHSNLTTIDGGAGDDTINNWGSFEGSLLEISGGTGNDLIYIYNDQYGYGYGKNNLIKYTAGDGNDTISGFNEDDTLQISGGSYSTTKSGKNIIVTVGKGKITLVGAASLSAVNITEGAETNSWKKSGTTATYGTADKTLVTVKGIKSLDGLSVSNKIVTVSKSSLNAKDVKLTGDGYKLALGDDVSVASTDKTWSYSKSKSTATLKQTKSAGYALSDDAKSITYSKKSTKTLTTVKGVKSKDGLSLSGTTVTVSKAALGTSKVTINKGYTLKLSKDVTEPSSKKAAWNYDKSTKTATYDSSSTTAGYTLADNVISYSKAKSAETLATINGAKSKNGLSVSGKKITLKKSALNSKVTVSGDYEFSFASDYNSGKITGSDGNDTIKTAGKKITIDGGKGNDVLTGGSGADIFVYNLGDGNDTITNYDAADKISIASGTVDVTNSGDDIIFNIGTGKNKGKVTVQNSNGKTITYFDAKGDECAYPNNEESTETVLYNDNGTKATLTVIYEADQFTPKEYSNYKNRLVTIDASAVVHSLNITGNQNANSIIGTSEDDYIDGGASSDKIYGKNGDDTLVGGKGSDKIYGDKGNDSLWGGAGSDTLYGGDGDDIFLYNDGDGNDVIADFKLGDKIQVDAENIGYPAVALNGDVTFEVGKGKIVIQNGADKSIQLYGKNGIELGRRYTPNP